MTERKDHKMKGSWSCHIMFGSYVKRDQLPVFVSQRRAKPLKVESPAVERLGVKLGPVDSSETVALRRRRGVSRRLRPRASDITQRAGSRFPKKAQDSQEQTKPPKFNPAAPYITNAGRPAREQAQYGKTSPDRHSRPATGPHCVTAR